jgi:hypothetical protein
MKASKTQDDIGSAESLGEDVILKNPLTRS